jgi:hypothetical protein
MLDSPNQATLTILDNDAAAVIVNPKSVTVTEGLVTDTYTITLTSQPAAPVTITLSTGRQASVSPTLLTFTALDWNEPQRVTVSAEYDAVFEGPHSDVITHIASSEDNDYDGLIIDNVTVNITDQIRLFIPLIVKPNNDGPAQPGGEGINPSGRFGSFSVILADRLWAWIQENRVD